MRVQLNRVKRTVHMAAGATYQVSPPERFNFSRPEEWPKWARRFERFQKASGLEEKEDEVQVNTLIYAMGDDADDSLRSFRLSVADSKNYAMVKAKFKAHFVKKRNFWLSRRSRRVGGFIYNSSLRTSRILRVRKPARRNDTGQDCSRDL